MARQYRLHIDRDNNTGTPTLCICGRTYYRPEPPCHIECEICGAVSDDEICERCKSALDKEREGTMQHLRTLYGDAIPEHELAWAEQRAREIVADDLIGLDNIQD